MDRPWRPVRAGYTPEQRRLIRGGYKPAAIRRRILAGVPVLSRPALLDRPIPHVATPPAANCAKSWAKAGARRV